MAGNIYSATLNIARGNDRKLLYDINNVRRIDKGSIADGVVPSTQNGRGSLITNNTSSDGRIAQNDRNVKKKFSLSPTEKAQRAQERAETAIVKAEISIHAPRVGSDSFPPASGAGTPNFNPRSPCGERRNSAPYYALPSRFQSTLPVWGATFGSCDAFRGFVISIHAPRVGSDASPFLGEAFYFYFNPRSPCGERLPYFRMVPRPRHFNPRSPCGERPGWQPAL